ncbi:MAG: tRNA 2-thiocytidine(32) synthetase TtcA [Oscillospiraceae bacterium]|nr:tRNA 2-thiocytidine(32) synthetase TtcA [Oscillospiraceae bacterium]
MIQKITSIVRRCIDEYDMIQHGETIAVGLSGGKDSLTLLDAMVNISKYHPKQFKVHAVTLSMGFDGMDFSPLVEHCKTLDVPYSIKHSDIYKIVFTDRKEKNPCSLCATMRRAALCNMIKELGIQKIALAHHYDDAVETFLMSLVYEGRMHCFQPVTYLDRTDTYQIRPMLYIKEEMIKRYAKSMDLPVIVNTCPENGYSKREEIKTLLKTLGKDYPGLKTNIFGAMQKLPLKGWKSRK